MSSRKRKKKKSYSSENNSLPRKIYLEESEELLKKTDTLLSNKETSVNKESEPIGLNELNVASINNFLKDKHNNGIRFKNKEAASEYEDVETKNNSENDNSSSKDEILLDEEKVNKIDKDYSSVIIDVEANTETLDANAPKDKDTQEETKENQTYEEPVEEEAVLKKPSIDEFIDFVKDKFKEEPFNLDLTFDINVFTINNTKDDIKQLSLWKDLEGNIHYSFNLLESKTYSSNITNINSLINEYLKHDFHIEISTDRLKDVNTNQLSIENYFKIIEQIGKLEIEMKNTKLDYKGITDYSEQMKLDYQHKKKLSILTDKIERLRQKRRLNEKEFELKKHTQYIYTDQLITIYKELFAPSRKSMFFTEINRNLIYKNSYSPSIHMTKTFENQEKPLQTNNNDSIILKFIFAMTKYNLNKAKDIFIWLAKSFLTLSKNYTTLVLYSKNDVYTTIFYKQIVEPLFNEEFCLEIKDDTLKQKKINSLLNNKVIYYFKDISSTTFLNAPIKELTDTLLNCDDYNLYNKKINTKGNILISSTSKHIPLIANEIHSLVVNVNHNIDDFSDLMKIVRNKHFFAKLIKDDLENFVKILRSMDINKLYNCSYSPLYTKIENPNITESEKEFQESILDGDTEILELFWVALVYRDKTKFEKLQKTNKNVYNTLVGDFFKNRILGINLLSYFSAMYGEGIYASNRALLQASKAEDLLDKYVIKRKYGNKDYYYILDKYW
jgi:hypothetical protein